MNSFIEIGIIVFIATVISLLMRFLRQPLIVGYILAGVVAGPYFLNLTQSASFVELLSKFGIAILLFVVGINLKPDIIREVGKVSILTGLGQIVLTAFSGFFLMKLLGFSITASFYGALALTFSSTIIVLKLLSDKGDLDRLYGKISIGILLLQDIFATGILLVVSIIGSAGKISGNAFTPILFLCLKGVAFFLILYFLSKYLLPKLLNFLANSQEMLFLFSISWGLGLAAVFYIFGFSLEIGALAAGVALASSPYSPEIASRMKPLRDFFILLFFVLLGSQIVLLDFKSIILPAIVLSIFVLTIKPFIVFIIMKFLRYKGRISFASALTMAQVSEFSLILVALGFSFGYLDQQEVSLITLVAIITITVSTYFFQHSEKIYKKLKPFLHLIQFYKMAGVGDDGDIKNADMIIFGYDRVGYDFVNVAQKINSKFFVVDFDPKSIKKLKNKEIPHHFGDADDIDFLEEIGIQKAKVIISTIPDFKTNLNLVSFYHNHEGEGIVIVISHNIKEAKELYNRGASFVIMPHYIGAKHASEMLKLFGMKKEEFEREKMQHLMDLNERLKLTDEGFNF